MCLHEPAQKWCSWTVQFWSVRRCFKMCWCCILPYTLDYLSCQLWSVDHYAITNWMKALTECLGLFGVWTEIQLIYVMISAWHDTFLSGELWFWMSEPRCDGYVCCISVYRLKAWPYLSLVIIILIMFFRVRTFRNLQEISASHF